MVILHIAALADSKFSGVCVVVPQHIIAQSMYANVGFYNTRNVDIDVLKDSNLQLPYMKAFCLEKLSHPFNHPDIVVFHECYRFDYIKISKELIKKGIPYIIVPHGELRIEAQHKKFLKKMAANILFFNSFISKSEALQCLSMNELNAIHFKKNKIIGTNGINIPKAKKIVFHDNKVEFIYIGRYEWRVKGIDLLFQAIKKEKDYLISESVVFNLFGPDLLGRLEEVRKMVDEYDIGALVNVNSSIIGDEKEEALLNADIFIQTSRNEGMPMGVLEAMSYGIPCVLTMGTTLAEFIEEAEAGWNAGSDPDSIALAIVRAINDRDKWKNMGKNSKNYVETYHSWGKESKRAIDEYGRLLSQFR